MANQSVPFLQQTQSSSAQRVKPAIPLGSVNNHLSKVAPNADMPLFGPTAGISGE